MIKYKISNKKGQTKLNIPEAIIPAAMGLVAIDIINEETPFKQPQNPTLIGSSDVDMSGNVSASREPHILTKEEFFAKEIEKGVESAEVVRLWLIIEEKRRKG